MADSFTRVQQLPERNLLELTDWLMVDNNEDTWKVQVSTFDKYIGSRFDKYNENTESLVENKINEIQMIISDSNVIIDRINENLSNFEKEEKKREDAEKERTKNEDIRQTTFADIVKSASSLSGEEDKRKAAEEARVLAEQSRVSAEEARVLAENQRKSNENQRNSAETNRALAESDRQTAETNRVSAENERKNIFNTFQAFFTNWQNTLDDDRKTGITGVANIDNTIFKVFEFKIPEDINTHSNISALIAVYEYNTTRNFIIGISIYPVTSTIILNIPEIFKSKINATEITAFDRIENNQYIITLKCNCRSSNGYLLTGILFDGPIDAPSSSARALSASETVMISSNDFNSTFQVVTNNEHNSVPSAFVNMIDDLTNASGSSGNFELYEAYPIGSIYQTTSSSNPSTALGGGKWKALYDGIGISEAIEDENGNELYSPVIYYWERIE